MLPFPLQIPPDLLFRLLHLFMEHAGRDTEGTMAQNDDLFHAIGGGHADAAALADLMGDTLDEHIGGLGFPVREYLDFVAELKKLEKSLRKRYVEEAMDTTGITDVGNRMIRNLSKGYRQRVGFAQAILGYPDIIILDEPTVGLDPKQIIEIRELIKKLGEKHTVILSSHILTEISAVCDHVFIISKGKLVASDATENLVSLMSGAQEIEVTVRT